MPQGKKSTRLCVYMYICAHLSLSLYICAVILVISAIYTAKFIFLWVWFAPWADRRSQIVEDCNLISLVLCQVAWGKQTQLRGCFSYPRKSGSQTHKSCGEAEHFQNHLPSKAFLGLQKRVTALVLMLSAFPRGEPMCREWNTNHGLSKGAQWHGKPCNSVM